ncbi:hypothetical protein ALC57_06457 [Trachymyrmex cornetzi]|uniref:Transmembrane protein n=1 Tax=Trachymyrmex cornetzi TaxID=471704 RepID=A0A151J8M8_9HYME|nr:hypothetical protein ALC57_06457 [Trachymyrmex cornetzi]
MSYDCCVGDGRVAGESLGAALRDTLHLIHEGLHELLGVDTQHRSWMLLLVVLAVASLLLVAGSFVTGRYHVASKVTRSLDRNRTITSMTNDKNTPSSAVSDWSTRDTCKRESCEL